MVLSLYVSRIRGLFFFNQKILDLCTHFSSDIIANLWEENKLKLLGLFLPMLALILVFFVTQYKYPEVSISSPFKFNLISI